MSEHMTLNEIADLYDKHFASNRPARTLPINLVIDRLIEKELVEETSEGYIVLKPSA